LLQKWKKFENRRDIFTGNFYFFAKKNFHREFFAELPTIIFSLKKHISNFSAIFFF